MARLRASQNASSQARRTTRSASAQPPPASPKSTRGRPRKSVVTAAAASQPVAAAPPVRPQPDKASTAPIGRKSKSTKSASPLASRKSNGPLQADHPQRNETNGDRGQDLEAIPEDDDEDGEAGLSALSGATAVGYNSDAEIKELRKKCDTFAEELPDLVKVSRTFIDALGEAPTFAEFAERLKTDRVLVRKAQKLIEQAHLYKSAEEPFIHPSAVVQAIFNAATADEIQGQPWSPDPIFRHANLGLLAQRILSISPESPETVTLLQILDHSFCTIFWGATIDSSRSIEAFNVALEVRTQLAIACVRQLDYSEDATNVIHEVFQDPRPDFVLRGWAQDENDRNENYWTKEGVQKGITQRATTRVNGLLKTTSKEIEHADMVETLLNDFSWQDFCDTLIGWIVSHANAELEDHINAVGGMERLVGTLQERVDQYRNAPPGRPGKKASRSLADLVRVSASAKTPVAQKRGESQGTAKTSTISAEKSAQSKGKFYKAQPNATKVAPISQFDNEEEASNGVDAGLLDDVQDSSNSGPSEFVTQDDGFQEQAPTNGEALSKKRSDAKVKQAAKRKGISDQSPGRLKRPRRATVPDADYDDIASPGSPQGDYQPAGEEETAAPVSRRKVNVERDSIRESSINIENVKIQSKLATQAYNDAVAKVPRSRIPWSTEEEGRLVELIEIHGTSWGLLKKHDTDAPVSKLQRRTPEDIRLKARLLKMDFLKTRQLLPEHFDDVKLNAAQIQKINDMGIQYLQPKVRGST